MIIKKYGVACRRGGEGEEGSHGQKRHNAAQRSRLKRINNSMA
jgi:hypothetical protein